MKRYIILIVFQFLFYLSIKAQVLTPVITQTGVPCDGTSPAVLTATNISPGTQLLWCMYSGSAVSGGDYVGQGTPTLTIYNPVFFFGTINDRVKS